MTKSISVAMATYNGQAFIKQQLQSILEQTHRPTELVIADDTSSDNTLEYVDEFARIAPFPVRVHCNQTRLGFRANFMGAIALCQSELIALCDQDDIWDPNKLATAAAAFDPETLLFFHNAWLIDQAGARIGPADIYSLPSRSPPLTAHSLFGPFGFSMVFDRRLLQFADLWPRSVDANDPKSPTGHDHWLFFLASIFGSIVFDQTRLTGYRQHQNNTFGFKSSLTSRLLYNLRLFRNNAAQYARLSHVAAIRAKLLEESQLRLNGVWLDRARAGQQGCQRMADRLGLRARLYNSESLAERVRIFLDLCRSNAYSTDNGFGLTRDVMVKDITLGVLSQRFLVPLQADQPA
jgi:glycosyltransferase involved in cell wall biosynthesis